MPNKYDYFIWFDSNIDCTVPEIDSVVNHLETEIQATRKNTGKKKRWQGRYSGHIRIIVLNLLHSASIDPNRYVAYYRNKNNYNNLDVSRYHAFTPLYAAMIKMVDILMNDLGYIEGAKGFYGREFKHSRISRMKATSKLIELVLKHGLYPINIIRNPAEEIIILKTKIPKSRKKIIIEYDDTADTIEMRKSLNIINNVIQNHFIGLNVCDDTLEEIKNAIVGLKSNDCAAYDDFDFDDYDDMEDGEEEMEGKSWNSENTNYRPYLDFSKVKLRRIFNNGSFEQGGRFYSGWWQAIPGRYRPYIFIDDKPTIEVDFSGIHINLLYLLKGQSLPTEDVYTIAGLPKESRKVLKVALQILLNSKSEARALRSIKNKFPAEEYPNLFKAVSHEQIIEAFKEKHKVIEENFYQGVGVKLQFIDSEIAEGILLDLAGRGIAVLPVHDSFIVQKEHVDILKGVMKAAVHQRFGQELGLKQDKTAYNLDREFLAETLFQEDLPASEEEYLSEWQSKERIDYLSRRDIWYRERGF